MKWEVGEELGPGVEEAIPPEAKRMCPSHHMRPADFRGLRKAQRACNRVNEGERGRKETESTIFGTAAVGIGFHSRKKTKRERKKTKGL